MPKTTPAEKISTISGSAMAHASLVRPSAFQLAVILACSAFISAKLLLCAIPKPPVHRSQCEGIARRAYIASLSDGGLAVHFARSKTRESVTCTTAVTAGSSYAVLGAWPTLDPLERLGTCPVTRLTRSLPTPLVPIIDGKSTYRQLFAEWLDRLHTSWWLCHGTGDKMAVDQGKVDEKYESEKDPAGREMEACYEL